MGGHLHFQWYIHVSLDLLNEETINECEREDDIMLWVEEWDALAGVSLVAVLFVMEEYMCRTPCRHMEYISNLSTRAINGCCFNGKKEYMCRTPCWHMQYKS